jgi:zinc protease
MEEAETVLSGSAPPATLEELFQELYRYFLPPRNDSMIFSMILNQYKQYTNPSKIPLEDNLAPVLGGYHVDINEGLSPKELDQVQFPLAIESYKECFLSPKEFTFAITGVQDMEKTIALVARYFGNLPELAHIPKIYVNKNFPEDKANVRLYYTCPEVTTVKDQLALEVLVKIMQYLTRRRLREKEGAIYSYSAGAHKIDAQPGHIRYTTFLYFGCKPQLIERLVQAALEEMKSLKKDGPTQDDFKSAHSSFRQFLNGRWPDYLMGFYQQPKLPTYIEDLEVLFNSITPDDIRQTAQKYLNENNLIRCYEVPANK